MVFELTNENFDSTVAESKLLFVDVWAEWCAPCRRSTPVFEKMAEKLQSSERIFSKLDAQNQMDAANKLGVLNLPTFAIFKDGQLLKKWAGADIARLRKEIDSVAN